MDKTDEKNQSNGNTKTSYRSRVGGESNPGWTLPEGKESMRRHGEESKSKNKIPLSPVRNEDLENEQSQRAQKRRRLKKEQETCVLWRSPIKTTKYAFFEMIEVCKKLVYKCKENRRTLLLSLFVVVCLVILNLVDGPHVPTLKAFQKEVCWMGYWFGLGVLSSIGLGTGLHTFLLYLGPHIASVTLAAYECGYLNFPEPPYPDEIKCPDVGSEDPRWAVSLFNIMSKVQLQSLMWGAGTAFGELPPYFMARASRLTGFDPEDMDDLVEFQEFQQRVQDHPETLSYLDRLKLFVEDMVAKVGFFGILACASIPNPLFDLAGITCGHFLVPFWTFFGATFIGKAVIKMSIQQLFVIVAFNEALIARAVNSLRVVPVIGHRLQEPVTKFFADQKKKFHGGNKGSEENLLGKFLQVIVTSMVLYFLVSIINALAQSYCKRLQKKEDKKSSKISD